MIKRTEYHVPMEDRFKPSMTLAELRKYVKELSIATSGIDAATVKVRVDQFGLTAELVEQV